MRDFLTVAAGVGLLAWHGSVGAQAGDPEALMKKRGCFKCHAVDRTKIGPAYRDVAAKYRGVPDADGRLRLHLTTGPKIRIEGHEEEHVSLAGIPDADLRAVVSWILSR